MSVTKHYLYRHLSRAAEEYNNDPGNTKKLNEFTRLLKEVQADKNIIDVEVAVIRTAKDKFVIPLVAPLTAREISELSATFNITSELSGDNVWFIMDEFKRLDIELDEENLFNFLIQHIGENPTITFH